MNKELIKKIIISVLCIVLGVLSFTVVGDKLSDVNTYGSIIETLDEKKSNVLGLTAATSASSVALAAIPGDATTPLANELANLSSYLMLVLAVIFLEKYLLPVFGFAFSKIIIPISLLLFIVQLFLPKYKGINKLAIKIVSLGLAFMLIIPFSVKVSNIIDETYEKSMDKVSENIEIPVIDNVDVNTTNENDSWLSKVTSKITGVVKSIGDDISKVTTEAIESAKDAVNNFVERTAVMIVTACFIPILTAMAFIWVVNLIMDTKISMKDVDKIRNKVKIDVDTISKISSKKKSDDENLPASATVE